MPGDIDYQGIVRHINEGIVIIREGVIVFANNAFERIAEVTKAFSKAFFYKEESYSTQTILDIFRSCGYEGDDRKTEEKIA